MLLPFSLPNSPVEYFWHCFNREKQIKMNFGFLSVAVPWKQFSFSSKQQPTTSRSMLIVSIWWQSPFLLLGSKLSPLASTLSIIRFFQGCLRDVKKCFQSGKLSSSILESELSKETLCMWAKRSLSKPTVLSSHRNALWWVNLSPLSNVILSLG